MAKVAERDSLQWEFHQRADVRRCISRLSNPFVLEKEQRLLGQLGDLGGHSVLEIGCGEGSNEIILRHHNPGVRYTGLDFARDKVAFAKGLSREGAYVQGDALHLPFRPCSFDLVFLRDVLHHLDAHREQLLAEALAMVRPGGLLVVFEGNGTKMINRLFSLLIRAERGMRNSTPESFTRMCRSLGATRFAFVEPFFFVRAMNYFLGWPRAGVPRMLAASTYMAAMLLERVLAPLCSEQGTSYMIAFFDKPLASKPGGAEPGAG
jgi:SAM-dependent methyltransferase